MLKIRWVAPAALSLAASVAHAGTISFTPVPFVDVTQPFLPGQAPTVFEVRLDSANAATINSIDLIIGTPVVAGTSAVAFPNDTGNISTPDSLVLATSFTSAFVNNAVRHEGDPHPNQPFDIAGYSDAVLTGGFAFLPQSTSAGILIGTLTIELIHQPGIYTFGANFALDGARSKLAGGSIPPGQLEPLYGTVYLVIPEPATVLFAAFGVAVAVLRGRRT